MELENRVAVVTGANGSIGKAICLELAKQGACVALDYTARPETAQEIADEIIGAGGQAIAVCADVTSPEETQTLMKSVADTWGGVDIVVNVAGIMDSAPLEQMTYEQWNRVININLSGAFNICRAAIDYLKKSKYGRIISIASQAAFRGSIANCNYCAAKAGMVGMTYALARELGKYNITVNTVSPGRVMTELLDAYQSKADRATNKWMEETPLGRFGSTQDIADMVAYLASDKANYITGANMNVNGGMLVG